MDSDDYFSGWDQAVREIRGGYEYKNGVTEPWSVDILCAIIRACEYSSVLEVGVSIGKTAERFLQVLPEDGYYLGIESNEKRIQKAEARLGDDPRWEIREGRSQDLLPDLPDNSFDFCWIDGNHDKDLAGEDVENALRIIQPDGLIAMHDVYDPINLKPLLREHDGIMIRSTPIHRWGGIGLIEP